MKTFVATLVSLVVLLCSTTALSAENPRFLFSRIKNKSLETEQAHLVVDSELPSNSLFFSSDTEEEGCTVYLHSQLVKKLPTGHLAVIMGHELAHCVLGHHRQLREAPEADLLRLLWEFEYEADELGLKLARLPGVKPRTAFKQLMAILPAGPKHPSGEARIQAIDAGAREYPESTLAAAASIAEDTR